MFFLCIVECINYSLPMAPPISNLLRAKLFKFEIYLVTFAFNKNIKIKFTNFY